MEEPHLARLRGATLFNCPEGNMSVKYLIDGKWTDGPPSQSVSPEQGVVHPGSFRRRVTRDSSSGFPIEPNRYHLYVSHACPFSQRATIVWTLSGLAEAIDLSILDPRWVESDGWVFGGSAMSTNDNGGSGFEHIGATLVELLAALGTAESITLRGAIRSLVNPLRPHIPDNASCFTSLTAAS